MLHTISIVLCSRQHAMLLDRIDMSLIKTSHSIHIKAKKTHGFNSCIVIRCIPQKIYRRIKKVKSIVIIDKLTS